jgi:hypothetical protein
LPSLIFFPPLQLGGVPAGKGSMRFHLGYTA